jgi:hypothetical protein
MAVRPWCDLTDRCRKQSGERTLAQPTHPGQSMRSRTRLEEVGQLCVLNFGAVTSKWWRRCSVARLLPGELFEQSHCAAVPTASPVVAGSRAGRSRRASARRHRGISGRQPRIACFLVPATDWPSSHRGLDPHSENSPLIVLQVWPGLTARGSTLITPGGISRSCCGRQPKPNELAVSPEQIGTLPQPGMLLLWGRSDPESGVCSCASKTRPARRSGSTIATRFMR